jgi:hypothetical protein
MVNSKSLKRNRANELWGTILMIDTAHQLVAKCRNIEEKECVVSVR